MKIAMLMLTAGFFYLLLCNIGYAAVSLGHQAIDDHFA